MQRVITIVRNTLQDLQLAVDGTIIMSEVGTALVSVVCCTDLYGSGLPLHAGDNFVYKVIPLVTRVSYRTSVMHWTTYMMPRFPRYGAR